MSYSTGATRLVFDDDFPSYLGMGYDTAQAHITHNVDLSTSHEDSVPDMGSILVTKSTSPIPTHLPASQFDSPLCEQVDLVQ